MSVDPAYQGLQSMSYSFSKLIGNIPSCECSFKTAARWSSKRQYKALQAIRFHAVFGSFHIDKQGVVDLVRAV